MQSDGQASRKAGLIWESTLLQFPDSSFDVVVYKGGLDALMGEESDDSKAVGEKFLAGVSRVILPGGVYLCVTLAQAHVLSMTHWPTATAFPALCTPS